MTWYSRAARSRARLSASSRSRTSRAAWLTTYDAAVSVTTNAATCANVSHAGCGSQTPICSRGSSSVRASSPAIPNAAAAATSVARGPPSTAMSATWKM
jgi:hypothetical protein